MFMKDFKVRFVFIHTSLNTCYSPGQTQRQVLRLLHSTLSRHQLLLHSKSKSRLLHLNVSCFVVDTFPPSYLSYTIYRITQAIVHKPLLQTGHSFCLHHRRHDNRFLHALLKHRWQHGEGNSSLITPKKPTHGAFALLEACVFKWKSNETTRRYRSVWLRCFRWLSLWWWSQTKCPPLLTSCLW